uniref:Uncharacterized protein n=1 Tax=Callorhinchus milii TaxID=7868 RepID=A0A4W3GRU4_CALMI
PSSSTALAGSATAKPPPGAALPRRAQAVGSTVSHFAAVAFRQTEKLTKDAAKIKANIRLVLEALGELQGLGDVAEESGGEIF